MGQQIVECVPNVSEGRDRAKVGQLAAAVAETPAAALLDIHSDADHNRSVITFAGRPRAVLEAAVRLAGRAAELIDLNHHHGAHPRIGALDVLPFVPYRGLTLADCAELAAAAGEEIWTRHAVPVYLYEAAARRPERVNLAAVRRGQFEQLRELALTDPERRPDIGGPALHPTGGAVAAGARKVLIAYNILLDTPDVTLARRIARQVRASSGGLAGVKAMGVALASRNTAQVSMNLTDYEVTPPHVVFDAVRRAAEAAGAGVRASELVGLIPRKAIELAGETDLRWENLTPNSILENRIEQALASGTLE